MPDALLLRGGAALTEFRRQRLLRALQAIDDGVADVHAAYLHVVLSAAPLSQDTRARVTALLDDGHPAAASPTDGTVLWVMPRLGTVSPWSSKATDIARVCGLSEVLRIERGVAYAIVMKQGLGGLLSGLFGGRRPSAADLADARMQALAGVLHDRMTESVVAPV